MTFVLGKEFLELGSGCRFRSMVAAKRADELANYASIGLRLQKRSLRTRPLHNRLSSIVETQRSDEVANQALDDFKNLFEKKFRKGGCTDFGSAYNTYSRLGGCGLVG